MLFVGSFNSCKIQNDSFAFTSSNPFIVFWCACVCAHLCVVVAHYTAAETIYNNYEGHQNEILVKFINQIVVAFGHMNLHLVQFKEAAQHKNAHKHTTKMFAKQFSLRAVQLIFYTRLNVPCQNKTRIELI